MSKKRNFDQLESGKEDQLEAGKEDQSEAGKEDQMEAGKEDQMEAGKEDQIDLRKASSDLILPPKKRRSGEILKEEKDETLASFLTSMEERMVQIEENLKKFSDSYRKDTVRNNSNQKKIFDLIRVHHNFGVTNATEPIKDLVAFCEKMTAVFDQTKVMIQKRTNPDAPVGELDLIDPNQTLERLLNLMTTLESKGKKEIQQFLTKAHKSNPIEFQQLFELMEAVIQEKNMSTNTIRPIDMHKKDSIIYSKIFKSNNAPPLFTF